MRQPSDTEPAPRRSIGLLLLRYGIGGVFLACSVIALAGCAAALFVIETRRRVLEEVSP